MPPPELNQVILGDCLEVMAGWDAACIDLAYLDPPFNTGRMMEADGGEYADRWAGIDDYLSYMRPRVAMLHRMLKPQGAILLHCDWRTCHHFRLMLDELFGADNFVNHLIWSYGLGGSSPRRFARKHDDILYYAKGPEYYFQPPRVPATSNRMKGQDKKATDVIEIPSINNMAAERAGYPTQKPVALLKLLIEACCPPPPPPLPPPPPPHSPSEGIVLDPFCGSGTTLVAAQHCGRSFIGIDVNPDAVRIARGRLADSPVSLEAHASRS